MSLPLILSGGGLLLLGALVFFLLSGPSPAKQARRRLNAIKTRYSGNPKRMGETQARRITGRESSQWDKIAQRYLPRSESIQQRLDRTGRRWTEGQYLTVTLSIFAFSALATFAKFGNLLVSGVIGAVTGFLLPYVIVNFMIAKRLDKFIQTFPDGIELLVRGLRAGLPIAETMDVVATEVPGPVGVEFKAVGDKVKIGRTMDAALNETADRLDIPEFRFFTIALAIQRETGGNLAETLSNLADVLRKRAHMKLKVKAMSSEAKASAYIIGALPFLVFGIIYYVSPNYMANFFVDPRLMIAAGGGMFWMGIGAFIMYKMVNFKI